MKKLVSFFLCLVLSLCATYSVALAAVAMFSPPSRLNIIRASAFRAQR